MKPFPVSEEKEAELSRRMRALRIRETDLEEAFVRSGGHGGQNVNKTSTCVQLTHRPTGIQVKCQTTRQQGLNRFMARLRLLDKLEAIQAEKAAEARDQREKAKRRKRKRSPAAKEKILKEKAKQSEKKQRRKRIDFPE